MNKIPYILLIIFSITFAFALSSREQIQSNRFDRPQSQPNFQSPATPSVSSPSNVDQLGGNYYRNPVNVPTSYPQTPSTYYNPNYSSTFPASPNFNMTTPSLQPQPQSVSPGQTSPYTQPGQYYNR